MALTISESGYIEPSRQLSQAEENYLSTLPPAERLATWRMVTRQSDIPRGEIPNVIKYCERFKIDPRSLGINPQKIEQSKSQF